MNIKKGLSLAGFGFLFILVNFNLTFNGNGVNIMPDFIGWILFFLAFGSLGEYARGYAWLKWAALILAVISAALWVLDIAGPELAGSPDFGIINSVVGACELIFTVLMFTPLIRIARDYGSKREKTLKTLRILDIAAYAVVLAAGLIIAVSGISFGPAAEMSGTVLAAGAVATVAAIAMLVCAVITVVTVFGLRKEVIEKTF